MHINAIQDIPPTDILINDSMPVDFMGGWFSLVKC